MKFNNVENECVQTIDGRTVWLSRSVAVTCIISFKIHGEIYVLITKRGEKTPDFQGLFCLVCGYLDGSESTSEASIRETYEETGFNLIEMMEEYDIISNDINYPWNINSDPSNNKQNVSVQHGIMFESNELPNIIEPTGEKLGEVSEIKWINVKELNKYEFAFNHDKVISDFINAVVWF